VLIAGGRIVATAAAAAVLAVLVAVGTIAWGTNPPAGLHVSGNRILDKFGHMIQFHGVNRSGTEYACIQGWGIFDGPSDAASVAAMASWHINIVRIPLNEDCWLGVNVGGINSAYTGQNYINAIVSYVNLLHQYGMYAELSLIWGAPGTAQATYQPNAPDEDHSPAMWTSMAETFKNDPNVILAPWGETTIGWQCFMQEECTAAGDAPTYSSADGPFDGDGTCGSDCDLYTNAPMQQAVTDMRDAGYNGPIAIPCIAYANVCADPSDGGTGWGDGKWLLNMPTDPDHQLIAEAHVYGKNVCDTTACFNLTMLPILQAGYPMIWGEVGETYDYSDCPSSSYIQTFLSWAEQNNVGTEAWTWDTWGDCSSGAMISDYDGTPEDAWAAYVESNYQTTYPANP
jgi:endoglucanase